MKSETRKIAIWELANKVNEYVANHNLFCGGCCYSAYILADIFTKLGIRYRVALFQSYGLAKVKDFDEVINNDYCDHVAIEVIIGTKRCIIGDYSGIMNYYCNFNVRHSIRKYRGITPQQLKDAYYSNDWNARYNTAYNRPLRENLYDIANKYLDKRKK